MGLGQGLVFGVLDGEKWGGHANLVLGWRSRKEECPSLLTRQGEPSYSLSLYLSTSLSPLSPTPSPLPLSLSPLSPSPPPPSLSTWQRQELWDGHTCILLTLHGSGRLEEQGRGTSKQANLKTLAHGLCCVSLNTLRLETGETFWDTCCTFFFLTPSFPGGQHFGRRTKLLPSSLYNGIFRRLGEREALPPPSALPWHAISLRRHLSQKKACSL